MAILLNWRSPECGRWVVTISSSAYTVVYHLKSIQAASTPPSFTIIVTPEDEGVTDVSVKLHVKYNNTYPRAPAIFSIQQPRGVTPAQVSTLNKLIRERSLELAGEVMVFEVSD